MSGADYVLKRTLFAIMTVFVALTLNFVLFRAAPGDATSSLRLPQLHARSSATRSTRELGLDKSKLEQYWIYLKDLAHGDLGLSFVSRQPVWDELRDADPEHAPDGRARLPVLDRLRDPRRG